MVKKVVFDFDGTLADSFRQMVAMIQKARPELGDKEIEQYREKGAKVFLEEFKIPLIEIMGMMIKILKQQNKTIDEVNEFKGIKGLIDDLKKNKLEVGILSSNKKENIERWLDKRDIKVDWIVSESNLFGKNIAINKIKSDNMIYVGDEVRDIEACKKTGVKIVAVSWGYNTKNALINAGANYVVDEVADLRKLLLSFNQ